MSIIKFIKKLLGCKTRPKGGKPKTFPSITYEYTIQIHGYEATIFVQFGVSQYGYGAYVLLPDGKSSPLMDGVNFNMYNFSAKDLVSLAEDVFHKWIERAEQSPLQKEFKEFGFKRVNK